MLFLEHDIDAPRGNRVDRWWDSYLNFPPLSVPFIMVDSGRRVTCGPEDYHTSYRALVDDALTRPPGAEIHATYSRNGDNLRITAQITNRSDVTLSTDNLSAVNALVWEKRRVLRTDRFVRAASARAITSPLAPGETASYVLSMSYVPVHDWNNGQVIVFVDYRPNPVSSVWDMLQAAVALDEAVPTPTSTRTPEPTPTPVPTITPGPSPTLPVLPGDEWAYLPSVLRRK